jgi:hypothetical protein
MKLKNSRQDKEDSSIPHLHAGWSMSSEPLPLDSDDVRSEVIPAIRPAAASDAGEATELPAEAITAGAAMAEETNFVDEEPVQSMPPPAAENQEEKRERRMRMLWTVGSVMSILLNCILLVVLVILGNQLFIIKKMVGLDLIGGLYANFVKMDEASIKTNITVSDQIPINFNLPISQDTVVTLREPTSIKGARVTLVTGGLAINNAPADIVLPAGTNLPVHLELVVPVQQTIPIILNVPVDIPLNQTELHEPFTGLQQVIAPFFWLLKPEWASCKDVPALGALGPVCTLLFKEPK